MTYWRAALFSHTVPQRTGEGHGNAPYRAAHLCEIQGSSLLTSDTGAADATRKSANFFLNIESYIIAMHGTDPRFQNGELCF